MIYHVVNDFKRFFSYINVQFIVFFNKMLNQVE